MTVNKILNKNFFDLFGIPISYQINQTTLRENFLKLQARFHPDTAVRQSAFERKAIEKLATQINQAYQVLCDPILRANYLLDLKAPEHVTINPKPQPDFLMAQMSLREEIEAMNENGSTDAKLAMQQDLMKHLSEYSRLLIDKFSESPLSVNCIKQIILEKQFYLKCIADFESEKSNLRAL